MTATPQTCLLTSVGLHSVAVLFFFVSTAFIPAPSPNLSSPVLEIVSDSVRLTDGLTVGGPETPPSNPAAGTPPTAQQEPRFLEDPVLQAGERMLDDAAAQPHGRGCGTFMHALQGRFVQMARYQAPRLLRTAGF